MQSSSFGDHFTVIGLFVGLYGWLKVYVVELAHVVGYVIISSIEGKKKKLF